MLSAILAVVLTSQSTSTIGVAQIPPPPVQLEGDAKLADILTKVGPARGRKIGSLMEAIAIQLEGTPYVGWTLERDPMNEFCFVSTTSLDCVTFFETTLGIARIIREGESKPEDLVKQVQYTRYRGGNVDGYLSRLHYTSDWMADNAAKGVVRDLSKTLPGSQVFDKKLTFMTANSKVYRQFQAQPELLARMADLESKLNKRTLYYVPLEKAEVAQRKLRTGDIIGITTSQNGMDCSHTGIIRVIDGKPHFMHASSLAKKVMLDVVFSEFLKKHSKATGFMAVRPL